jgi:hypothetical protein
MSLRLIIAVCLVALQTARGSELLFLLDEKVQLSDLVAIGKITDVKLGEISGPASDSGFGRTQLTTIRFRIDERILGRATNEIVIEAHSVSFSDGSGSYSATAGFSNYEVTAGKRFIAYLKRKEDKFVLSLNSNQFLEWVDDANRTVRDVGQTRQMVPLEMKLKELKSLAKTRKGQPGGPANGSRPIRSETNSTSSAAGSRR